MTSPETPSNTEPKYCKVLLKLSGEALQGEQGYGISAEVLDTISNEIAEVSRLNIEIAIVIGGGNIFRGVAGASKGIDLSFIHICRCRRFSLCGSRCVPYYEKQNLAPPHTLPLTWLPPILTTLSLLPPHHLPLSTPSRTPMSPSLPVTTCSLTHLNTQPNITNTQHTLHPTHNTITTTT